MLKDDIDLIEELFLHYFDEFVDSKVDKPSLGGVYSQETLFGYYMVGYRPAEIIKNTFGGKDVNIKEAILIPLIINVKLGDEYQKKLAEFKSYMNHIGYEVEQEYLSKNEWRSVRKLLITEK